MSLMSIIMYLSCRLSVFLLTSRLNLTDVIFNFPKVCVECMKKLLLVLH